MRLPCMACVALAASSCLPDVIPKSARKDLVNGGERYAVGLWVNDWPAGHASAQLVKIILQERSVVRLCVLRCLSVRDLCWSKVL